MVGEMMVCDLMMGDLTVFTMLGVNMHMVRNDLPFVQAVIA